MPWNPEATNRFRMGMVGGSYNAGLSYWSGFDPASVFPFVANDILKTVSPNFTYYPTLEQRLGDASPSVNPAVNEWTPEIQGSYGRLWGTLGGPPSGNPSAVMFASDPTINGGKNNLPDFSVTPEPSAPPSTTGPGVDVPTNKPGWSIPGLGTAWNLSTDLTVIIIGIMLLSIAAYSIIVPRETRGAIIKSAIGV